MQSKITNRCRANSSARLEVAPASARLAPKATRAANAFAASPVLLHCTRAPQPPSSACSAAAVCSPATASCHNRVAIGHGATATPARLVACACAGSAAGGGSAAADAAASAAATPMAAAPAAPYWKTYISRKPLLVQALFDCLANLRRQGPLPDVVDVALVYVSSEYLEDYSALVETLRSELPGLRNVFGCTGFGVIGLDEEGAQEVEAQPALSLTLATLPQAEVVVRHLDETDLPDGDAPPDRWSALLGVPAFPEAPLSQVVLSDPSFAAVQDVLAGLDFAFPSATKIGGLSSSSAFGGSRTATFSWSAGGVHGTASSPASSPSSAGVYSRGASVMSIYGEVQMDLMIAQGCRPLTSTTWTVDRVAPGSPTQVAALSSEGVARGRSLPALEAFQIELQSVLGGMSEVQLRRTVANLTVGVAPEGLKETLEPQDFLIRALRGFDSEQCLVVGEHMRVGQRVRFMVRDKQGAQEDLDSHGLSYKRKQLQAMLLGGPEQQASAPFGMLMFTCNGRGSGLYGENSYDARTMSSYVPVPCAGFQCNGEIGRVGDTTHLHGFTCAVGVLRLTGAAAEAARPGMAAAVSSPASASPTSKSPPPAPPSPEEPSAQQQQQQQEQ
ncbi:hypothetical protein PLESTB_000379900 [Pleodorina starrii]|uniref:FIST C-domain domain-containing protein n=1 Tax=Pleodorina starrii TaxID=330485 RepID=A0A9W6EYX2_9CHLO|nr:hypothetical protein PLESTB_000379900 [Pleodorina starrii]GLC73320.1 hypothetical protein PLESTF_001360100 [Pleodorina starrii]